MLKGPHEWRDYFDREFIYDILRDDSDVQEEENRILDNPMDTEKQEPNSE
jgi:hypothetical protein